MNINKTCINDLLLFKRIITMMERIVDECELEFVEHDINIKTMDDRRIALFRIKLKDILEKPLNTKIGVNLGDLKVLLGVMKYDTLKFEFTSKLMTFKKANETFTLKTVEFYDGENVPIENMLKIAYTQSFSFDRSILCDIYKKAIIYSSIVALTFDEKGIEFESNGNSGKYVRNEGMINGVNKGTYSLEYLEKILNKTSKLFPGAFTLEMKTDHPLHIIYEDSTFKFEEWLAPRVEKVDFDEEDDW